MSLNTILATAPLATTGFHIKATGTTLGNSLIWDNGTNVGIGNTNTSYTLDVSGTGRFTSTLLVSGAATFSGFVGINGSPATGFPLEAYINSATAYSSTSRGNVMRVYNSNTSANIFAGIELGGAGTANDGLAGLNAVVTGSGSAALTFYTRDSNTFAEKMRITSAGNVGIGTTTINGLLSLKAFVTDTPTVVFQNPSGGPNSAISNFTSSVQTFTVIGTNFYVNSTANTARFNTSYAGCGIIFDEGILRLSTGTTSITPTTRMTIDASGNIGAPSGTNIYNASDVRLKQNVTTITNGLDKILDLNPVMFNWIDGFVESEDGKDMLGFIAQEVQNVIPQAVENFGNNSVTVGEVVINDTLRVNEKFIIPVLVKAIQEINTKLDEQNQTIQNLQEQINILAK